MFCPLITNFLIQHFQMKKIIQTRWNILQVDPVPKTVLSIKPEVVFRRASNLRDQLAPNIINPPLKPSFFSELKGFYPCNKCVICTTDRKRKGKSTSFLHQLLVENTLQILSFHVKLGIQSIFLSAPAKNSTQAELRGD